MEKIHKKIELYCGEGRSDKVYLLTMLEVEPNKFQVLVQHGGRGKQLKEYRKPSRPTTLPWVENFYDTQLRKKQRRGYTEIY
jgi:hypothetical protein